jgi:EmrB/QacA subfamily drug resistance transporter
VSPSPTTPAERAQRWVLVLASAASLLVGLDVLVVSTALPTIRADIGASPEQLQWTVNSYTLVFAVLLMPAVAWGDRFGRRRVFLAGLTVFSIASLFCALATGPEALIAARSVQGLGAALVMPTALGLLTGAFEPADRPRALGVFASTTGASVSLGPILGGLVVHGLSWPWIFWLNVPLGLALAWATRTHVPESERVATRVDVPGVAWVGLGSLGVVWGLVRGNDAGWASPEVIAAFAVGLAGFAAFLRREATTTAPMMPLSLFRESRFAAGTTGIFLLWGSALGAIYFIAQFFQAGQGHDALGAGLRLAPWGLATVLVPRLVARRIPTVGEAPFIWSGTLLHGAGLLTIGLLATEDRSYAWLCLPLVLSGVGCAMAIPALQSQALSAVDRRLAGTASGAFSMVRQLGGATGLAAMGAAFGAAGSYASSERFSAGFTAALVVGAVIAGAAAVTGGLADLRHRMSRRRPSSPDPADDVATRTPAG